MPYKAQSTMMMDRSLHMTVWRSVLIWVMVVIENAQRHFQGSLFGCFEYVPYTALTIVLIIKRINVRLD